MYNSVIVVDTKANRMEWWWSVTTSSTTISLFWHKISYNRSLFVEIYISNLYMVGALGENADKAGLSAPFKVATVHRVPIKDN